MSDQYLDQQLEEISARCGAPNWDGYGSLPVNASSLAHARLFLKTIDPSSALPEISVDPDGEVSFDWHGDSGDIFSMSISETGMLSCAYLSNTYEFSFVLPPLDGGENGRQ